MLAVALVAAALVSSVYGHGQVHSFITTNPPATYPAADAYAAALPNSPIRKLNTYAGSTGVAGSGTPFTGPDITCGPGGNVPVSALAPVVAGSKVTFSWNPWNSVHPGPIMTYIAACTGGCANFKGDSGTVWVKIDHDGYNPNRAIPWAEENILQYQTYTVTVPASIPNGEYLLRHEILGLHVAYQLNGAQFYPNCVQIQVTGSSGTSFPTNGGIALPGAYDPNASDILVQLYTISPSSPSYLIPGGPVIINGGPAIYGGSVTATPYPSTGGSTPTSTTTTKAGTTTSTTTSKATTTSTTTSKATTTSSSKTTTTTTTTASGATQTHYGQCGGQSYTGPTVCASPYTCQSSSIYYSQCL